MARVLVVDDSPLEIKLLSRKLGKEGYELLSAPDGKRGLEVAAAEQPDVVLMDIQMPGMDGLETCRRFQADPKLRGIPIIMATACSEEQDVVRGLDAGAHDYVTKPLNWSIVGARVRSAVRSKKAHDTIARAARQLAQAEVDAQVASECKSKFLANMSHEIRTPLTAILGFAETLLDLDLKDPEQLNAARIIHRNGEYLLQIINDILDISKIEVGKMKVEQIAFSPAQVVSSVRSLMQVKAGVTGLRFEVIFDGPIPETIQSDPTRLQQILINLIGNALKFTEVGGVRLIVRTTRPSGCASAGGFMQFDVIDSGIGMTKSHVASVFQPFAQADVTTARKYGGTGLGLTISRRLAEMLGGEVRLISSTPGVGSHFRATVATGPLQNVRFLDNVDEAAVGQDHARPKSGVTCRLRCRILLAEDGPDNERLISFILRKAGASVTTVENGQLAVEQATAALEQGNPFDVILMDMEMPVLDGSDATRSLRANGYAGTIIALTAHAMAGDRQECLDAGCDNYATKPIDQKKLIETIREALGASGRREADSVSLGA